MQRGYSDGTTASIVIRNTDVPLPDLDDVNLGWVLDDFPTNKSIPQNRTIDGYDPDIACGFADTSGEVCLTAALKAKPSTSAVAAYQAPSSGDPAASFWQIMPYVTALTTVGLALVVLHRRPRVLS